MEKRSFYRPEIDGLRALAIIPVILFHAGIAGFSGGFVGVDIFFVISGFLITSIILKEMKQESFSLVRFWERRARRIIPAMFFITSIVVVAAYFIVLFPVDFIDFGQSLVAQSLFLANIFFMRKSSYFAGPSESMPLLHTWSLSVEEQFYIGFPILLLALAWFVSKRIYTKVLVSVLIAIAALSFAYSIYLVNTASGGSFSVPFISHIWGGATNLNAGFFFLPARAWELLIGALLATGIFVVRKKWLAEVLSAVGIMGIIYAVVAFGDATPFPGYAALIPTLGCALIIAVNTHVSTAIGQFLSFPVLVWIGLISYSLYLWHWPIIVFSKVLFGELASNYIFGALLLTFILAWVTYKFVETPFREKKVCAKTSHMFLFSLGALVVLVCAGLAIHFQKGFPERASEEAHKIAQAAVDINPRDYECFRKNYKQIFTEGKPCILGDQTDTEVIDFVLWGDSNADAAMPIIDQMAIESGVTGAFFGAGGCGPIVWDYEMTRDEKCLIIKDQALAYIKEHEVKKVLLISAWESDRGQIVTDGALGRKTNTESSDVTFDASQETFDEALRNTLKLISTDSNEIYLMRIVPMFFEYDIRKEFNKAARSKKPLESVSITYEKYAEMNRDENQIIDRLVAEGLVTALDPTTEFCPDGICSLTYEGKILYKNGTHINTTGAMLLRPIFEDFFVF